MNRQVVERAVALTCAELVDQQLWETGRISESESGEEKTYPALSVEVEDTQPVAGNGKYCSVVIAMIIEGQVETPDSQAAAEHAARVEDLCGRFDSGFLTALNIHAASDFECLGFAERPPVYTIEGRLWSSALKIVAGIIWLRSGPILDESDQPILDEGDLPILD